MRGDHHLRPTSIEYGELVTVDGGAGSNLHGPLKRFTRLDSAHVTAIEGVIVSVLGIAGAIGFVILGTNLNKKKRAGLAAAG